MKYRTHFEKFVKTLNKRLAKGYEDYSDKSFDLPVGELIKQMEEECLDVCGWGLILWIRLREMEEKIKEGGDK